MDHFNFPNRLRRFFASSPVLLALLANHTLAQPAPIRNVSIEQRAFEVNGRPFIPLMAWLQDAKNFPAVKDCGMNTTAGYWSGSSGTKNVTAYLELVRQARLYGVMPFDPALRGHPALLGYIQGDEPDLPHQVNDAQVSPGPGLKINRSTPLWKLVDGVTHSWSVLDPLQDAAVTVQLPKPVTVARLAVWLTISSGLSVAHKVRFTDGQGRLLLEAALQAKKGRQAFDLSQPATFKELQLTVTAVTPGQQVWGSFGEIEAFDQHGKNVLLSPPHNVPRAFPAETLKKYRAIKKADPTRPVFMTFTGYFHPIFKKWNPQELARYPEYIQAADAVGFDIYPIYGWNKPEWIHLVHEGTERLVRMAGNRPVYAWIETSKGGQYTGPLERQHPVTPAHIKAEVWMALCRGATAIGYFTHVWKPAYRQFGVPDANRQALREINRQITRLTPHILGQPPRQPVTGKASGGTKVDVLATTAGNQLSLFAVNFDPRYQSTKVTFQVHGLRAGDSIVVVDEGRTLTADDGAFTDTFDPLAVHIYAIKK